MQQKKPQHKFSKTTDMMLVIMHNEGAELNDIANILNRMPKLVKQRIIALFKTGMAYKIHKKLILYGGLYARRMAGKPWPDCRFDD